MAVHLPASTPAPERGSWRHRWTRIGIIAVTGFSSVNAIAGGVGLLISGLGVPREQLEGTPFDSFAVPGLLLAIVVGGSMAIATISAWQRVPWAATMAMVAGSVMLGWIAIESIMITEGRLLQVIVALLALAAISLGSASRKQAVRG